MAKNTKAQQVSTGTSDSYTDDELNDPAPPIQITRAMLGAPPKEDAPSVGTDSSPSSESASTKSVSENPFLPPPAPTMENPSGAPEKETDSTADSTVGAGQEEVEHPQSDEDKPAGKRPSKKQQARVRSTTDDDDFSLLE